jgi:hypothetical protein
MKANIPLIATLFCVFFSARIALAFLRENPRLFTAQALFTFSWTLLLPYWSLRTDLERSSLEIVGVYTGFLHVYIGGLLLLHALSGETRAHRIAWLQVIGLRLLLLVVTPTALLGVVLIWIDTQIGVKINDPESVRRHIMVFVGTLIGIVGFICVAWGVRRIGGWFSFVLISVIFLWYTAIGIASDIQFWIEPDGSRPLLPQDFLAPSTFEYWFAILKCAYTLTFGSIIAYYGMPEADRQAGFFHWLGVFGYLTKSESFEVSR